MVHVKMERESRAQGKACAGRGGPCQRSRREAQLSHLRTERSRAWRAKGPQQETRFFLSRAPQTPTDAPVSVSRRLVSARLPENPASRRGGSQARNGAERAIERQSNSEAMKLACEGSQVLVMDSHDATHKTAGAGWATGASNVDQLPEPRGTEELASAWGTKGKQPSHPSCTRLVYLFPLIPENK